MLGSSMRFNSFLAFTWTINKCSYTIHNCCNNQDHKNKYHAREHKKYPGKPFSTREENRTILFYILKRRSPNHKTLMHTRGCSTTLKLAPKRGAQFIPRRCACWKFKMTSDLWVSVSSMGKSPLFILDLDTVKVVSIGTTKPTSIT